jgi:primosomal protein N' (replication factor Y)
MKRCLDTGAVLLLGSATPSVESWRFMNGDDTNQPLFRRLNLTKRLAGGTLPQIRTVPLQGVEGCLSPRLREEIRKTTLAGKQAILFLNRRGSGYFYHCPACGFTLKCKNCDVSLTWHKDRGRAVCHYCGYETAVPSRCPECGSTEARFIGFGTERIEEEVKSVFPSLRVTRLDADAVRGAKGTLEATLASFKKGDIDVLIGTQMVAKGLNFPGVSLVGVIMADSGLLLPDFRSAERTFSLLVQVAGRAGRYTPDGLVIVQAFKPKEDAITLACKLDMEDFYRNELVTRQLQGFPPYGRLVDWTVRSKNELKARAAIVSLGNLMEQEQVKHEPSEFAFLGPVECPLSLVKGNYRFHIITRGNSMRELHAACASLLAAYKSAGKEGLPAGVYLEIDVDPVNML